MKRFGPGFAHKSILLLLAIIGFLFFWSMMIRVDPDVFFHLKEGSRVLTEWRMPTVEEYSFTRYGKSMIATEWLSGAIFAALFGWGGYSLLAIFCSLLLISTFYLLYLTVKPEISWDEMNLFLLCLSALGFLNFALAKVQNFTFLFFALFLYWTRAWEKGKYWVTWAMAGTLAIWVNLHGGFMLGLGMLLSLCVLRFIESKQIKDLSPIVLGTIACFIHPNGVTAFLYPIWFFFYAPPARSTIVEWTAIPWNLSALPYLSIIAVMIFVEAGKLKSRFPWTLMAFVFFALGIKTRKMLPFFVLSAAIVICLRAQQMKLTQRWQHFLNLSTLFCLISLTGVIVQQAYATSKFGSVFDWQRQYPRVATDKIAQYFPGRRIFHQYEWGGFLLYKLSGEAHVPIFIDGRLDPYWTLMGDYETMIHVAPGWQELLKNYKVEIALLIPHSPLAEALENDKDWKAIGQDGRAELFARGDLSKVVVK